jgi:hypothetical protein
MKLKNFALAATMTAAMLVTAVPLQVHAEDAMEYVKITDIEVSGVDLTPVAGQPMDEFVTLKVVSNHDDILQARAIGAWVELDDNNKFVSWLGENNGSNPNIGWPGQAHSTAFKAGAKYGYSFCVELSIPEEYDDKYGVDLTSARDGNVTLNGVKVDNLQAVGMSSSGGWVYSKQNTYTTIQTAHEDNCNKMYRLYNPNSGEHFYTSGTAERQNVVDAGWNYEGIGWLAPKNGTPVFRMYNPVAGEHHYTTSKAEADALVAAGWNLESECAWYSASAETGTPLYREYNPNQFACNHNYTSSQEENDLLVNAGWQYEGIAWYGIQ